MKILTKIFILLFILLASNQALATDRISLAILVSKDISLSNNELHRHIHYRINSINRALRNSKIDVLIRYVGYAKYSWYKKDVNNNIPTIENSAIALNKNKPVQKLRDLYGIDLVIGFQPQRSDNTNTCGATSNIENDQVRVNKDNFSAVIAIGLRTDGQPLSTSCNRFSVFSHEIGHIMGLAHRKSSAHLAKYNYGVGIVVKSNRQYSSIMSGRGSDIIINKFSNPNIICKSGYISFRCGEKKGNKDIVNSARAIENVSKKVADYKISKYGW